MQNEANSAPHNTGTANHAPLPTQEQLDKILEHYRRSVQDDMTCVFLLVLDGGLQDDEFVNLRWADVDLVNSEIVVRPTDGTAAHVVRASSRLRDALEHYGSRWRHDLVFFPFHSRAVAIDRITSTFQRTCRRLEYALTLDSLRRAFAVGTRMGGRH